MVLRSWYVQLSYFLPPPTYIVQNTLFTRAYEQQDHELGLFVEPGEASSDDTVGSMPTTQSTAANSFSSVGEVGAVDQTCATSSMPIDIEGVPDFDLSDMELNGLAEESVSTHTKDDSPPSIVADNLPAVENDFAGDDFEDLFTDLTPSGAVDASKPTPASNEQPKVSPGKSVQSKSLKAGSFNATPVVPVQGLFTKQPTLPDSARIGTHQDDAQMAATAQSHLSTRSSFENSCGPQQGFLSQFRARAPQVSDLQKTKAKQPDVIDFDAPEPSPEPAPSTSSSTKTTMGSAEKPRTGIDLVNISKDRPSEQTPPKALQPTVKDAAKERIREPMSNVPTAGRRPSQADTSIPHQPTFSRIPQVARQAHTTSLPVNAQASRQPEPSAQGQSSQKPLSQVRGQSAISSTLTSRADKNEATRSKPVEAKSTAGARNGRPLPKIEQFQKLSLKNWAWREVKQFLETAAAQPRDLQFLNHNRKHLKHLLELQESENARVKEAGRSLNRKVSPKQKETEQLSHDDVSSHDTESCSASSASTEDSSCQSEMSQHRTRTDSVARPSDDHPQYGGKQPKDLARVFGEVSVLDASDEETEVVSARSKREASPITEHDELHYQYRVMRKQWTKREVESEANWFDVGDKVYYNRTHAILDAEKETTRLRYGIAFHPIYGSFRLDQGDENDDVTWDWSASMQNCFLRIKVERTLLPRGGGVRPENKQNWLPGTMWIVKKTTMTRHRRELSPSLISSSHTARSGDTENCDDRRDELDEELFGSMEELDMDENEVMHNEKAAHDATDDAQYELEYLHEEDQCDDHGYGVVYTLLDLANRAAADWLLLEQYDPTSQRIDVAKPREEQRSKNRRWLDDMKNQGKCFDASAVTAGGRETVRYWVKRVAVKGPKNA